MRCLDGQSRLSVIFSCYFFFKEGVMKWTDAGVMSTTGPVGRFIKVPLLCTDSSRTFDYLVATSTIQGVPGGMDKTSGECSLC